jgi:phosphodiesterase/alkaline phosphatase D-like protein
VVPSLTVLRRTLLAGSAAVLPLLGLIGCGTGSRQTIRHILPTVTDTRISISCSLAQPVQSLLLRVSNEVYTGEQRDSEGAHWSFTAKDLIPNTQYELQLLEGESSLGDAWPLRTFPAEGAAVDQLKLAAFTCAGGGDAFGFNGLQYFKPHAFRRRLFDELLAQNPDAIIAIGDHIYWDLRGGDRPPLGRKKSALIRWIIGAYLRVKYGVFDRALPLLGSPNEAVLKRIADEQIADLYGTRFKSTPIFFISDDHDYFENDDAEKDLVTFPADTFSREAHRAVADLYYPPLPHAPTLDTHRSFGLFKYGNLFEAPLLDCAGHMSLAETLESGEGAAEDINSARLFPEAIEQWVLNRIEVSQAKHFALVPSHPMGWTAGKWREWYPDVVAPEGFEGLVINELNFEGATKEVLITEAQKYLWQRGWWAQHQRLLQALSARSGSRFTFSGDIHAQGAIAIEASGDEELPGGAVTSLLVGPVSTSDATWPSFARGIPANQPGWLRTASLSVTEEVNGFTVFDITSSGVVAQLFNCGGHDSSDSDDGRVQRVTDFILS